jgi:hypothetical protein
MRHIEEQFKRFYREIISRGDCIEFRGGEEELKELVNKARKPIMLHIYEEGQQDDIDNFSIELAFRNPGLFHLVRSSIAHFRKRFADYDIIQSTYMILQPGPERPVYKLASQDDDDLLES